MRQCVGAVFIGLPVMDTEIRPLPRSRLATEYSFY